MGVLLRRLQQGITLGLPASRPLPALGARCHELRVIEQAQTWRLVYRVDSDAVVIAGVFAKTSRTTPKRILDACKRRLRDYDAAGGAGERDR